MSAADRCLGRAQEILDKSMKFEEAVRATKQAFYNKPIDGQFWKDIHQFIRDRLKPDFGDLNIKVSTRYKNTATSGFEDFFFDVEN